MKTPEDQPIKPLPKLTRKQAEFVRQLVEDKKISGTQAVLNTYNVNNPVTAASVASENLRKPQIISALDQQLGLAERTITGTMTDWGKSQNTRRRELALDAAKYTHDKLLGKATQRVEQQSVSVNIAVDLT